MKLTESRLRQIIREEVHSLSEASPGVITFKGTLEPIETLRLPGTPKPGDMVDFHIDPASPLGQYVAGSYYNIWPSRRGRDWYTGRVLAIKREGDGFYYRITAGHLELDVSFKDVLLEKK